LIITRALGPFGRSSSRDDRRHPRRHPRRARAVLSEEQPVHRSGAAKQCVGPRVLLRHVLPNVVALGIIVMTTLLGTIILAEAALSFLGLGIPNASSWGKDVNTARQNLPYHIPSAVFPGAEITLTVLGFNLLGDSIRDIADPRLRGSR
jgi:ABC-type microcin C transport system permease subunit YejE